MMKKLITNLGKFIILRLIYPHQYRKYCGLPLQRRKVIFLEVRGKTLGNSMREVYRRISADHSYDVRCHFLTEGTGPRSENVRNTKAFLKDMATAEYVFLSEANNAFACFEKRPETKVIQLWHGCGAFKRFGLSTADLKFGSSRAQQQKYPLYRNLDLVTVSSPEVIWAYKEAMGVDDGIIKATGISRTDVFFDKGFVGDAVRKVREAVPAAEGRKVILYAPTFRGDVTHAKAPDRLDIRYLMDRLGDRYVLLIKHHPFIKERPGIPAECSSFAYDITEKLEIDDLLCAADVCISDYSSLVFEYALFRRPMIFFAYDLELYNDWRGFYYDYEELTPGPVVDTTERVAECIEQIESGFDSAAVERFVDKFMSSCDGHATDRILAYAGIETDG